MTPQEHYERAEKLLVEGAEVVGEIRAWNEQRKLPYTSPETYDGITRKMDEYGKQAMGIWAQAQVHATLATVAPPMRVITAGPYSVAEPVHECEYADPNQCGWPGHRK